jgi:hypothetical protein
MDLSQRPEARSPLLRASGRLDLILVPRNGHVKHRTVAWTERVAIIDEVRTIRNLLVTGLTVEKPADRELFVKGPWQMLRRVVIVVELLIFELRRMTFGKLNILGQLSAGPERGNRELRPSLDIAPISIVDITWLFGELLQRLAFEGL